MPYQIRKVNNKNCFSVKNKKNGKVRAKCTTRKKAIQQVRLLHMVDRMKK
jgi:hypothetical protein